jgi:sucrose-6-phosphate hydrolase SacC (GH32 family)
MTLTPGSTNLLSDVKSELVELCTEFTPDSTSQLILTIRGATIVYEGGKQELTVNGHRAPAPLQSGKQRLTIFCDRNGLEVFASDGLTYVPMPFLPQPENQALAIRTAGGNVKIASLEVHRLKSAWRRNSR